MLLFCHIEVRDAGFAPNPFWKYLTLANCKPAIRRKANIGDWIIGLSPSKEENKIIYCMKVKEVMTFEDYYNDGRFKIKRPIMDAKKDIYRKGDNIYPRINEGHIQLFSRHSHKDGSTNMPNACFNQNSHQRLFLWKKKRQVLESVESKSPQLSMMNHPPVGEGMPEIPLAIIPQEK